MNKSSDFVHGFVPFYKERLYKNRAEIEVDSMLEIWYNDVGIVCHPVTWCSLWNIITVCKKAWSAHKHHLAQFGGDGLV